MLTLIVSSVCLYPWLVHWRSGLFFSFLFLNFFLFWICLQLTLWSIHSCILFYRTSEISRFSSTQEVKKFSFAIQLQIKLPRIEMNRRFWCRGFVFFLLSFLFLGLCVCLLSVHFSFISLVRLLKFKHMKILNMHRDVFGGRKSKKSGTKGLAFFMNN